MVVKHHFDLKNAKKGVFDVNMFCLYYKFPYICTVFFMVLDLRLTMKIGCRETTFLFL